MKISIITINLNNNTGLRKTIESVISQTYVDFEHIIIDGGSTDGSVVVIEEYKDKITYWVSEPDKGIYNAMNKGIKIASGEYCLFLNSGDRLISNDIMIKVSDYLNGDDIVFGDAKRVSEDGILSLVEVPESPGLVYFSDNSLIHASTLIKKKLFGIYGFYNEVNKIVSDWEFFIKTIVVNGVAAKKIPVIFSVLEENGISRTKENVPIIKAEVDLVMSRYFSPSVLTLIADYKKMSLEMDWIKKNPVGRIIFNLRATKKRWKKKTN